MDISEDDPRFEAGNDGLYAIMCYNKQKIPESEIKEDFSKFGEIVNYRALESGCIFIRFGEKKELIDCYQEMSVNHKYYARLPSSKAQKERRDDKPKEFRQHTKSNDQPNQGKGNNFNKHKQQQEFSSNDEDFRQPFHRPSSRTNHTTNPDEPPPLVDISEGAIRSLHISSVPHHLDDRSSSPPPLRMQSDLAWGKESKNLHDVPAVEVIVANLPSGIYQSELFNVCSAGEPLHIEMTTTPSPYQINYATVYVKTLRHAQFLIAELNGKFLEDNLLVVALADTIVEEADKKQAKQKSSKIFVQS